jgi:glycosyltransferase involved in cell wall biosynthesis
MWPYFTRRHDRWLNRRLLARAIAPQLAGEAKTTAITTLPLVADLIGQLPVERWVYYCVDDFSVWPGLDGRTLDGMERELVAKVDGVVAASEVLRARMRQFGREDVQLLTHGVDLQHWQSADENPEALWPELPRPWLVFWGLIDRRLDTEWLAALSQEMSQGTILLVGPTQDFDPRIETLPRVALRPALPYAELPRLARAAAALLMPYADLPVTRAMQPLKLLEYLATGKPVIARDLPAVAPWRDALDACDN